MTTLRDELLDVEADDALTDQRVKPALLALIHDQADLLVAEKEGEYGLRDGFPSRRHLIEWYQRASVRTLGHIAGDWPPEACVADEVLIAATVSDARSTVGWIDDETAKRYRQMVESVAVQPAFSKAYSSLRQSAKEYIQRPGEESEHETGKDLVPDEQAYLAMRPGFQMVDKQQARALEELWGGFDTADALLDWVHGLNSPSNGEIEDDLSEEILIDGAAMDALVYERETDRSRKFREAIAATVILPAFVDAVSGMDTDELAQTTNEMPTTLRMKGGQHESRRDH